MATTQLSRAAFERLQAEFVDLTTRGRIEVAQKIETARLMGDLSENGDYHAAKDEQGQMEGRIRQLEHIIETAEIIEGGDEGIVVGRLDRDDRLRGRRRLDGRALPRRSHGGEGRRPRRDEPAVAPRRCAARRRRRHVGRVRGPDRQAARTSRSRWRLPSGRPRAAGHPNCHRVRRCELPGRGTTFVRTLRWSDRRADGGAAARLDGDRRHQLVHVLPRHWPSTSASSPSTIVATAVASDRARPSGWRIAPTTPSPSATCWASTSSSPSATRWAGRSPN